MSAAAPASAGSPRRGRAGPDGDQPPTGELYTEADAARLLRVPRTTLHYWLTGGRRAGRTHGPVITRDRTGTDAGAGSLTWGEFLDAAVLSCLLPASGADAGTFGEMLGLLRQDLGLRRPLAVRACYEDHLEAVHRAQQATGLAPALTLVRAEQGGLARSPAAQSFWARTDWNGDTAVGWCPHDGPGSPVRVRPGLSFGRPSVGRVATATLWEHARSGEDAAAIAVTFGLGADEVRWGLAFEASRPENRA